MKISESLSKTMMDMIATACDINNKSIPEQLGALKNNKHCVHYKHINWSVFDCRIPGAKIGLAPTEAYELAGCVAHQGNATACEGLYPFTVEINDPDAFSKFTAASNLSDDCVLDFKSKIDLIFSAILGSSVKTSCGVDKVFGFNSLDIVANSNSVFDVSGFNVWAFAKDNVFGKRVLSPIAPDSVSNQVVFSHATKWTISHEGNEYKTHPLSYPSRFCEVGSSLGASPTPQWVLDAVVPDIELVSNCLLTTGSVGAVDVIDVVESITHHSAECQDMVLWMGVRDEQSDGIISAGTDGLDVLISFLQTKGDANYSCPAIAVYNHIAELSASY